MSEATPLRIGIIIGSTRTGGNGDSVGRWVHDLAVRRGDAHFQLIDLTEVNLPFLDEPLPPSMGRYSRPHTMAWSATIDALDGYVFVTPEYNGVTSAALKNALDFLFAEWRNKAAGFVGYGAAGGARAIAQLRPIMGELGLADIPTEVALTLTGDFVDHHIFKPADHQAGAVHAMLDEVLAWAFALRPLRVGPGA